MVVFGDGIDFANDRRKPSINDSRKKINEILKQYYLAELDLKNSKMVKFFVAKFLDDGIKFTNIEKIFKIGHRKMKRILEK